MAERVLTDCKLYVDSYDLSGQMNALASDFAAELQDATAFGDLYRTRVAGLKTFAFNHAGNWAGGATQVDAIFQSNLGLTGKLMTICPTDGTAGERALFFQAIAGQYTPVSNSVGEVIQFSVSGEVSSSEAVHGKVLLTGAKTTTGNGSGIQLGAVGAAQKLYAGLHVIAASGTTPTLDVVVESDDNGSFTSATSRVTFTQATGITSQWATPVAGAITDDYWRVSYTIGGTGPSFTFVVVVGIQ